MLPFIIKLFNRLFENGEFPVQWTKIILIPLHKKGNVNNPDNYRGIALIDVLSKVYISIITKRLTFYAHAYAKISESQGGFREKYSSVDNGFILYTIVNKYLSRRRKSLYVAFVDFQKAFDSVNRNILYDVLQRKYVKGKLFDVIKSIYKSVQGCVKTHQGFTDTFDCPLGLRQGCSLSPILFSLFIDDLNSMMHDSNVRGVQMFPNLDEIFMLMFADDIALISDTTGGLQKELNILYNFCEKSKLVVNVGKTKIMVFKRGGALSRFEKWSYGNCKLDVVNCFNYVGMLFTSKLSMFKMADAMSAKAKKATITMFNSLHQFSCLPYDTFFKLFDTKISPIMLYGSELWALNNVNCIEKLHLYACKRFLNVKPRACNNCILGDLGRYPMYISAAKRCIKYWIRLLQMPNYRYLKMCYDMMLYYDNLGYKNWVTQVRINLFTNGFGYIWEMQRVDNPKLFLLNYVNRLKDQYVQNWSNECQARNKLFYYHKYKHTFCKELYVSVIDIAKFRSCLANFRSSSHCLSIEIGRHHNIEKEYRTCFYCESLVEDEFHFILVCPLYEAYRSKYIQETFWKYPTVENFARLMSSTNTEIIRNLAIYLFYSFELRNTELSAFGN